MNSVAIYHHLGLGDTIECSGIVREYCKKYDSVYIFCKKKYFLSIKRLFKDVSNLNVVIIEDEQSEIQQVESFLNKNKNLKKIVVGFENYFSKIQYYENLNLSCSEAFYEIAGLPYQLKYNNFKYERNFSEEERIFKKINSKNEKYIFVHDDDSRNFKININSQYKIIKNIAEENIFDMLKLLENAEEIHCIPSSFLCFIDCISEQIKFKKLFLHHYVRKNVFIGPNSISKQWTIIK